MHTQTSNQKVFENVKFALGKIENYHHSRNIANLQDAEIALSASLREDSEYLDAVFYSGVLMDLMGRSADSPPFFERILKEVKDPNLISEAQFNLGVSYYHRYGHEYLNIAESYFVKVINSTNNRALKKLAIASLAQTYAMWMIPNAAQKELIKNAQTKETVYNHIKEKYSKFNDYSKQITLYSMLFIGNSKEKRKINAIIKNARGIALMYYSDYLANDVKSKLKYLNKSLTNIKESEKLISNDWAYICNLGSVHWRIALATENKTEQIREYEEAIQLFNKVITSLRPNYGFAFYELGRIYRTKGDFDKAIEYFNLSLGIEDKYREVSNKTVNNEKGRAERNNSSFP
ncbi:MAG: tetratricopeptide repeat protein [Bacteroidota bacterium]|nr:tetratricopeptide repeat protein [Bacteroidota bacterium]